MQAFTLSLQETYTNPGKVYTSFNALYRTYFNITVHINNYTEPMIYILLIKP